jgi:hypothetical protein
MKERSRTHALIRRPLPVVKNTEKCVSDINSSKLHDNLGMMLITSPGMGNDDVYMYPADRDHNTTFLSRMFTGALRILIVSSIIFPQRGLAGNQ